MSSTRQSCFVQARQSLLCQSKGQTAGSNHETRAGSNQQTHCCDQSTRHMLCQSKIHTAVSNHETHHSIKARRRWCDAHGRRQTLLLCHRTIHQTVRALPSIGHSLHPRTPNTHLPTKTIWGGAGGGHGRFCFAGGGGNSSGSIYHFVVPWEAGGPSPLKPARLSRTPQNTIHRCCVKHETTLLYPSTTKATVSKQGTDGWVKPRDTCWVKPTDTLL